MVRAAMLAIGVVLASASATARAADPTGEAHPTSSDCEGCPEMVVVPAGRFVMGTPGAPAARGAAAAEGHAVQVEIPRAFGLGRREVTRGEYARFIAESGHEPQAGCRVWDPELARFSDDARRGWQDIATPETPADDLPVSCVSFADALAYVQWLSSKSGERYRLPSESEWEYAARAGTTALRPWGDDADGACEHANTYDLVAAAQYRLGWDGAACRDGHADLAPVGQFEPNAFGLQDMIGNVREWVQDCATGSYVGRPRDARAWEWIGGCAERVQRGGSWLTPAADSRSAWRGSAPAGESAADTGFRVAKDIAGRAREER